MDEMTLAELVSQKPEEEVTLDKSRSGPKMEEKQPLESKLIIII